MLTAFVLSALAVGMAVVSRLGRRNPGSEFGSVSKRWLADYRSEGSDPTR
jgi:hypothetical protein